LANTIQQLQEEVDTRRDREKKIPLAHLELDIIFNTVSEGTRVIDNNFVVMKANKALAKLSACPVDRMVGNKCYDTFPGSNCHTKGCPLTRIMQGESFIETEVEKKYPDGTGFSCILTASPYKNPAGELLGIVETFKDISVRKNMEKELLASLGKAHKLTEKLEAKQKELSLKNLQLEKAFDELKNTQSLLVRHEKMASIGTLAGGIAHEFNNILGAMLGYTDMAREAAAEGSQTRADLEKVLKAGNRAKDLVKEILAFSRQSDQELRPIQIRPVVKEAINLLQASTPSSVEVRQNISSDTKVVLANATMIHQVLVNLYTNAVHAMGEKGVIEVILQNIDHRGNDTIAFPSLVPGEYVQLSVSDNGPGIDLAIKGQIFDPFFTTKEVGQGTGMGLSVVHGIIEKLGGLITVDSEPGKGASFHVFLPVTSQKSDNRAEDQGPMLPGSEHILFVDDEIMLAHMGKQLLERLGYKVSVRTSSIEALEAFRAQPQIFDLIITDQTMPNLTGAELAMQLLKIRPETPIILCTGYSSAISEDRAKAIGIRAFVMKPVDKKVLAHTIRQVLDGDASASELQG
jgi:PAS domain S-box-containing protein